MTAPLLQQRCWNHEAREAVCRCLGCGRSFCRECVTEHESRLLCAACLRNLAETAAKRQSRVRRLTAAGLMLAGVAIAWAVFLTIGETLITFQQHAERTEWQYR